MYRQHRARPRPVSLYQMVIVTSVFLFILLLASRIHTFTNYLDEGFYNTHTTPLTTRYYTKCGPSAQKHNPATLAALSNLNIKYASDPKDAILYLPCGYNYMEPELAALNPANPNQVIFAVKGADQLCSKNQLWHRLQYYWGRDRARQLAPETWVVANIQDMAALNAMHIDDITNGVFILKKNIQRKRGLQLVRGMQAVEQTLGEDSKWRVVQRYILHPLCIQQRKLNLRVYICIVCPGDGSSPAWWLHPDGKCIYTASTYDPISSTSTPAALQDRRQHFTSFDLDPQATYGSPSKGRAGLPESFRELADLPDVGPSKWHQLWLDIVNMFSAVRQAYQPNTRLANYSNTTYTKGNMEDGKPGLCFINSALSGHRCFQLFGADIIVDTNASTRWRPLILEFNKGPEMSFKSPQDKKLKPQVMTDCIKLGLDADSSGWQAIT